MPRMISTPPPSLAPLQPARQVFGRDRDHRDGRDRDRGAEPHDEGRGDAGPEQALRQRKHQHQDRARTGPQAHGKDRAQSALPAAGTGELVRRRPVGMAAMLVMDMAVTMIVVMVMVVTVVMVVAVTMVVMAVVMVMTVVMMRAGERDRRRGARRLQRADKAAALGPDQAGAERRDQARSWRSRSPSRPRTWFWRWR